VPATEITAPQPSIAARNDASLFTSPGNSSRRPQLAAPPFSVVVVVAAGASEQSSPHRAGTEAEGSREAAAVSLPMDEPEEGAGSTSAALVWFRTKACTECPCANSSSTTSRPTLPVAPTTKVGFASMGAVTACTRGAWRDPKVYCMVGTRKSGMRA